MTYGAVDIIGLLGGMAFPFATGFQTLKVFQTKSAKDISYAWQSTYAIAHVLYLVYSVHFGLWVIYSTQIPELFLLLLMMVLKYYYDNVYKPVVKEQDKGQGEGQDKEQDKDQKTELENKIEEGHDDHALVEDEAVTTKT